MPAQKEDVWLRPLGSFEQFCAYQGYMDSFNTVQAVWLESEQPIDKEKALQAAKIWRNQTAILQVCVRRRGLQLYFHKLENDYMDFEVVDSVDPAKAFDDVRYATYNVSNGPLWLGRLVLNCGADKDCGIGDSLKIVTENESEKEPARGCQQDSVEHYRALLLLGVQHVLADAYTNFVIAADYIKILNNIILDKKIEIVEPDLGDFPADAMLKLSYPTIAKEWLSQFVSGFIDNFQNRRITFNGKLPFSTIHEKNPSKFVKDCLSVAATQNLISKCKKEKVTVHSCVVTAANIAYYKMVKSETSFDGDSLTIYFRDCVNLRRYFQENDKTLLGSHISFVANNASASASDLTNFWSIARDLKSQLHLALTNKSPLAFLSLFPVVIVTSAFNFLAKKWNITDFGDSHYCTTNMGEVSHFFDQDEDSPVRVTDVFRTGSSDLCCQLFTLVFHTFRGQLCISCDYYTNKVQKKYVVKFMEELMIILQSIADEKIPT